SIYLSQFSLDGRTLQTVDWSSGMVRVWDAIPETLPGFPHPHPAMFSSDARFKSEFVPKERGAIGAPPIGDLIVKDAKTGKEIGRIPGNGGHPSPQFVANSQRLLVNTFVRGQDGFGPNIRKVAWALYDTDGLRRITGGERTAGPMNFVPGLETSP